MFPVFQAGHGHFSNNYSLYRESFVPEYQPGGGGFNIFCFNLNNLYSEHKHYLNWWNVSNRHLNMVRYKWVKLKLYRQRHTDWVFTYQRDWPMEVTKFHYPSTHPQRMLMYHHKIIVPSYDTAPLKRKPYVSVKIKPPNELINKWYFQQDLAPINLLMCSATACSLNYMFINPNAESNNITLNCLNTKVFERKNFEYPSEATGYTPKNGVYMYGVPQPPVGGQKLKTNDVIYLGNTTSNVEGTERGQVNKISEYTKQKWGNPFFTRYLNRDYEVFISTTQYTSLLNNKDTEVNPQPSYMIEPLYLRCRYNPLADDGNGNEMYWLTTVGVEQGWDTDPDPDLVMRGYPLWLMGWGWEDWTRKLGKAKKLDQEWVLVIKTNFIRPRLPAYVILSEAFVQGKAPYGKPIDELDITDFRLWYPRWFFQKEAMENLLMCGPSVARAPEVSNIQAHLKYDFFFKWGGNPAYFQSVADPAEQPIYPTPRGNILTNEIENPESSIYKQLYGFDIRRDMLTKKAIKRITESSTTDPTLFTDGEHHSTFEPPIQKEDTQEKTPQKEEKTSTERNLELIQLYNQQLQQRLRKLASLIQPI